MKKMVVLLIALLLVYSLTTGAQASETCEGQRDLEGKSRAEGLVEENINGDYLKILFTNPVLTELKFTKKISRTGYQDIAVYNGNIFDFSEGYMSINGGTAIEINNGHGNNAMFGTELHGEYPYLYCGSWYQNDCKIYINEVTNTSASLVRTISFDNLSGYLNMCVDEENNKIYILLCTSPTTPEGIIDLITADLTTGEIYSRKSLDFVIPIIQGMQFVDGLIYVTYGCLGYGVENVIMAITTDGNIACKSAPIPVIEIEGFSIDGNTVYIADVSNIYIS